MRVAVVGAGAAGLLAARFAAKAGGTVRLLESTRDGGRKILVSGGGRCNLLPVALAPERYVTDSSPHLLRRMLLAWPLEEQRAFFEEEAELPLVEEEGSGKLFPAANASRVVRDRLVDLALRAGVEFRTGARMVDLRPTGEGWRLSFEDADALEADRVVLATGGLSLPRTGSDGQGLTLARQLGHEIAPPYPALTPLLGDRPAHHALRGISVDVRLRARAGRERRESRGGFLFTHRGYSGPAVLDLSHLAVRAREGLGEAAELWVRWTGHDADRWEKALREPGRGTVLSLLREQLPERLARMLLEESDVAPDTRRGQLTRPLRRRLVETLSAYPLPWTGHEGYRKAEVTGGGVRLEEVDRRRLESVHHRGLFLCGEILDAFGPIGGHNFAWAWATGRSAGLAAATP